MEDLNFIEKLVNEIDVPTQQILIEAFVVTVTDSFEKNLGTRLGMYYGPDKLDDASIASFIFSDKLSDSS